MQKESISRYMSTLFFKRFLRKTNFTVTLRRLKRVVRVCVSAAQPKIRSISKKSKKSAKRLAKKVSKKTKFIGRRITGGLVSGPRTISQNIRFFANPGPQFEERDPIDGKNLPSRAKTIAFYLPQFHAFPENDEWWGKGFTEWRNVARGTPRFKGHYQPRVPRDLGFYDLNNVETIQTQCDLAKHNGIDAFCFYYYWFNGKRLMEKPLDLLASSDINQDFCIMWANENWTRTWDGLEKDVLIEQNYRDEDEDDFIADTGRYMADSRYVRMNGQPLFILYRPGLLPNAKTTLARWRKKWTAMLGETPLIMMVQGFGEEDPRDFGLDGAVEFPPHKVCAGLKNINDRCQILDPEYTGLVRDYNDVVNSSLREPAPDFPLIKTVSPHWDNDARREGAGMTLQGSTPALYEKWLNGVIDFAVANPVEEESVVFINAWNEWAEGAYLEPDVHYGHAYLNATKRCVKGLSSSGDLNRILLVGHDACPHGAQMLLLNIAKMYKQQFGMEVVVALKEDGPLLAEYKKVAQTVVLNKLGKKGLPGWLAEQKFTTAICNTAVTGDLVPTLRASGIKVVSLIHELPNLIKDYKLEKHVAAIASSASHIVFAAQSVQDGFYQFSDSRNAKPIVKPQGTYAPVTFSELDRTKVRASLGIDLDAKIVLSVGYADLRKGFDLFMDTARRTVRQSDDVHFVWVGGVAGDMRRWIQSDTSDREEINKLYSDRIHIVGFSDTVSEYYSAADVLFLPSREDPYPTVCLEAMNVGLPVLLYRGKTGFDSLMEDHGYLVELGDTQALDNSLVQALNENDSDLREKRIEHVETHCQFDSYCFDLLLLLHPELKKISVVAPNFNYAQYLEPRLSSIYAQDYPVFEVILLDDYSADDSVSVAQQYSQRLSRNLNIITNEVNSGNVFNQWHHAARVSRGDMLWIAEADDSADVRFLSTMVEAVEPDTGMVFCDSRQIGADGEHLSKSYQHYYSQVHPRLFSSNFHLSGTEFCKQALAVRNVIMNVSSVLWDKDKLKAAMTALEKELPNYQLVGDWRIYLELLTSRDTSVAFVSDSLNIHRRHGASVTHTVDPQQHIAEIMAIHEAVLSAMPENVELKEMMQSYIAELSSQLEKAVPVLDKAA